MLVALLVIGTFFAFIPIVCFSIAYFLFKKLKKKVKTKLKVNEEDPSSEKDQFDWRFSSKVIQNPYPFVSILEGEPIDRVRYFVYSLGEGNRKYIAKHLDPEMRFEIMKDLGFYNVFILAKNEEFEENFTKKIQKAMKETDNPYHQLEFCRFLSPPSLSKEIVKIQKALEETDEEIADEIISILVVTLEAKALFTDVKNYEINHKLNTLVEYDLVDILKMYNQLNRVSQQEKKQEILNTLGAIKKELQEIQEFSQTKSKFEFDRKMTSLLKKYNKK